MEYIKFEAKLFNIQTWTILLLPKQASAKLPSRGQTMVKGTINGFPFQSTLEPDGRGSHWFRVDKNLQKTIGAGEGDNVKLEIESTKEWIEPEVPEDIKTAVAGNAKASLIWDKITASARWDWIRWIRGTNNPETRRHRIEVALSKMNKGMRRPCCFNQRVCTEPSVSKNGVLIEPAQMTK